MQTEPKLMGYHCVRYLQQNEKSMVIRAMRSHDQYPCILKFLTIDYPVQDDLNQLEKEYALLKEPALPGVWKPLFLNKIGATSVLGFEDFPGVTLSEYLGAKALPVREFLNTAFDLALIFQDLHSKEIVHGNPAPGNILIDPDKKLLLLINFHAAFRNYPDRTTGRHAVDWGTDLSYIAPEQTGRIKSCPDPRSDLYSLGVLFYRMLTGKHPFDFTDPVKLLYAHIASDPLPPAEITPDIPGVVSRIILKLLAKSPDDRYQSASGLLADMQKCLADFEGLGMIREFEPDQSENQGPVRFPQKCYGRENELKNLRNEFTQVMQGDARIVMLSGPAGIGKSFLIEQFARRIAPQKVHFISGKFEQYNTPVPYVAFIDAFQKLIGLILAESVENFEKWRERLQNALGSNGRVLFEILPDLEHIIGPQPQIARLGPLESQNRFNLALRHFLRAFADTENPLVMFIDDCQWADPASLSLMKVLLTDPDVRHFLFIGAHRDHEFNANPQCLNTLNEINHETRIPIRVMELAPLGLNAIVQFLSDTFQGLSRETPRFAGLLLQKTRGHPLFIRQLLESLCTRDILQFSHAASTWHLDWNAADTMECHDTAADLIVALMKHLRPEVRNILQAAAAMGNIFNLPTLARLTQQPEDLLLKHLNQAIENHFIVHYDSCTPGNPRPFSESQADMRYRFLHDRIQQAAYDYLDENERKTRHLQIGRLLLEQLNDRKAKINLFDVTNHLSRCLDLIINPDERLDLARIYLQAGQKAKHATAFQSALDHFETGLRMVPETGWQRHYDLTLALFTEATEAAFVCGKFEQVEHLSQIVFRQAEGILDKIKIYEIVIQTCIFRQQLEKAVQTGLQALALLGIRFPQNPGKTYLILKYLKTCLFLAGRSRHKLLTLPIMNNPRHLAGMRIISTLGSVIYWSTPNLLPAIIFQNVISSIKHGNCPEAPYAYAGYGLILCSLGRIDAGYEFGHFAHILSEKFGEGHSHLRAKFVIFTYLYHWKKHINEALEPTYNLYLQCLNLGENEFAAWALMVHSCYYQWAGHPLELVKAKFTQSLSTVKALKQETAYQLLALAYQGTLNLLGLNENPVLLKGDSFDEDTMLPLEIHAKNRYFMSAYCVGKMFLCYLFGQYDLAFETSIKAVPYLETQKGSIDYTLFTIYDSLIQAAVYEKSSKNQKSKILTQLRKNQKRIKRWAEHAPQNYLHRYHLIEAERKRILGDDRAAAVNYEHAIKIADENGYRYEAALANERAAQFYLSRNLPKVATAYLMEAHYLYDLWGAKAKTKQLETDYQAIFLNIHSMQKRFSLSLADPGKTDGISVDSIGLQIDVQALLRAGQAIADEIIIDKLLSKLIRILMENAGANKVILILKQGDQFILEAEGLAAEGAIMVLHGIPLNQVDSLPKSVIHYVIRKRESLVLDHAKNDQPFADDPYIKAYNLKSILCLPLLCQNELIAVCYMENNLSPGVFTRERIKILEILASQAAISLKNALILRDYQNELEERKKTQQELDQYKDHLAKLVEERTNELIQTNKKLEREILEKSRMETRIKASLKEKETLLQEIHHRVKNNMQIISSLLNLQSRFITDEKTSEIFKESRNRVQSMALIHEILYQSDDLARINLEKYVQNLVSGLYHSYGIGPEKVHLEIRIEKVLLDIDFAIPCGLIISELVSNALKYAFPPTLPKPGIIRIILQPSDHKEVKLIIADNGVGIHSHTKPHQKNSLGLKLVSILVEEQLHGSLSITEQPGTVFTIRFPFQSAPSIKNEGDTL